jgi:hypothetical protein
MWKRKLRRWLYVLFPLVLLGLGTCIFAPDLIRWYVEDHYPDIDLIGPVEIVWGGVHFHNVAIKRPGLEALLDLVEVDAEKRINIEGGEIKLSLDKQEGLTGDTSGGESLSITASGLTVEVHRKDLRARLEKTRVTSTDLCFESGTVKHRKLEANVWGGCVRRDKSAASVDRIEVPIKLPFKIPRVPQEQVVIVLKATVSIVDRVVKFESANIGPFTILGPATVKLPDDGDEDTIYFDASKVVVNHPWIAPHTAYFNNVGVTASMGVFKGEPGKIRLRVGRATVHIDPYNFAIHGDEECGNWLDFLPHPLPEALQEMDGNYGGRMRFEVAAKPIPNLDIKHNCTYTCSAEPIKNLRSRDFTYMAYDAKGKLFKRKGGPWSPGWVSIADLPPHIPHAFVLLEDPGFYAHDGILPEALENSLKVNLAKGEFVKGGSTITMQLAKNLWLKRHKTIGRKAYEALLTVALESCLGKAQILEWYMNVVEYGPDLYGIGAASKHYFHKPAEQLEVDEAFYLASLLPHPKDAVPPDQGGLDKVHRLMQMLANSGIITEYLVPLKEGEVLDTRDWEVNE